MFRETEQGKTQYCPMCEEWAEKYERLEQENERMNKLTGIFSARLCEKYKQALEEIRARTIKDCDLCTSECDCDETCYRCWIKDKINEVLESEVNE